MMFPDIDPVIFAIGPFAIRWYGLAYIAGLLLGCGYVSWLNRDKPVLKGFKPYDDLLMWLIIGIVLGGRLGYVLFYNPSYYLGNPSDILKIWQGGMAFHGGVLGVLVATILFCKKKGFSFWQVSDLLAAGAPIGLFFGRIANFINAELYGRVTNSAWGIVFPSPEAGNLPRHPSQLYEAALEGVVLFFIMLGLAKFYDARSKTGLLTGVFLAGYALARMFVEQFREPDSHLGFVIANFTMGQLLSLPMLAFGIYLIVKAHARKSA